MVCSPVPRSNLKGLYRGDIYSVYHCQRSVRPSRPALVCWMGYTSFTAAHLCLGRELAQSWPGTRTRTIPRMKHHDDGNFSSINPR